MALAGGLNGGRVLDVHGEGEVRVHDLHKRTVWRLSLSGEHNVLMDSIFMHKATHYLFAESIDIQYINYYRTMYHRVRHR